MSDEPLPRIEGQARITEAGDTVASAGEFRLSPESRLAAKHYNEHVKLLAGFLNTASLAVLGAGLVVPMIAGERPVTWAVAGWTLAAAGIHLLAHAVLLRLRREE